MYHGQAALGESVTKQVYQAFLDAIAAGKLAAGDPI